MPASSAPPLGAFYAVEHALSELLAVLVDVKQLRNRWDDLRYGSIRLEEYDHRKQVHRQNFSSPKKALNQNS